MRVLAIVALGCTLGCGSSAGPADPDRPLPAPPARPGVSVCFTSERDTTHWTVDARTLPEAVYTDHVWTARIEGQAVTSPSPAPFQCGGFTPTASIAFDDAGGKRWWLEFAVREGGVDVTPALASPAGKVTATLKQQESFAQFRSIALSDEQGLLVALDLGRLQLGPEDAGGLATSLGDRVAPVYGSDCGHSQERAVTFAGDGRTATVAPGDTGTVQLSGVQVNVWNLDTYDWVGGLTGCTDLTNQQLTFAWRPAGG